MVVRRADGYSLGKGGSVRHTSGRSAAGFECTIGIASGQVSGRRIDRVIRSSVR